MSKLPEEEKYKAVRDYKAVLTILQAATPVQRYLMLWLDHETGFYEVKYTIPWMADVKNDTFRTWCVPYDQSRINVISQQLVAGDEHFKTANPNWWTSPPYNLPALNERWLQIMDDEKWWVLLVQQK